MKSRCTRSLARSLIEGEPLEFGPSKEYGEFGKVYQDVHIPGLPLEIFTVKRRGKTLYLVNLLIEPPDQRKGYGTRAVQVLKSWAMSHGIEKIVLESIEDAVEFWRKQGFQPEGRASESDWTRMVLYLY